MSKPIETPSRSDFPHFEAILTRWSDNDIYGHVNNVAYYSFFDTAVNRYLISACGLDIHEGDQIGLVVETGCRYFAPIAFPDPIEIGIRVDHIGTSSVRYVLGVFKEGADDAVAEGRFTHVYVDRQTRRPKPLNAALRSGLEALAGGA